MPALPQMKFVGPVIRATIAQLQAQMAAQVAAFNAAQDLLAPPGPHAVAPATYHFGGQDMLNAFPFPQIEVAAVIGDSGAWAIGHTEVDHDPRLNIAIWVQGDVGDVPTLYQQTLGLVKCVIECMAPANAFGPGIEISNGEAGPGFAWRIDVIPNDPTASTPAEGRVFQKWLGSGLIQFHLEDVERFT